MFQDAKKRNMQQEIFLHVNQKTASTLVFNSRNESLFIYVLPHHADAFELSPSLF